MATKKYLRVIICFVLFFLSATYNKYKNIYCFWLSYDFVSYSLLSKLYKFPNFEFISEKRVETLSSGGKELLNRMKELFGKESHVYKTVICNV